MRTNEFYQCEICKCYYDYFNEKFEEKDMPNNWLLYDKFFICEDCLEKLRKLLGEKE